MTNQRVATSKETSTPVKRCISGLESCNQTGSRQLLNSLSTESIWISCQYSLEEITTAACKYLVISSCKAYAPTQDSHHS